MRFCGAAVVKLLLAADAIPTASLWEVLWGGGPLILPIVLCSFVLVLVTFERTLALRSGRVVPKLFVERFLLQISEGALDRHQALELCEANASLAADVFAAAVRKWGKPAVEVEQAVLDQGERSANSLRRLLRAINETSGGGAMGRPEALAAGIGAALMSPAAGLCVAIPALILHLCFVGRVDVLVMELDRRGQELVNLISAEGLEDRRNRPPRPARVKRAA